MPKPKQVSLFDSRSKVLFFSKQKQNSLKSFLKPWSNVIEFLISADDKLNLIAADSSGNQHTFNAPANGAVVFVTDKSVDKKLQSAVMKLWADASFPKPKIIDADKVTGSALKESLCKNFVDELEGELVQTAQDAVRLDKQIAALREELENSRSRLSEVYAATRLSGELPTIGFERRATNSLWDMGASSQGSQLLPFSGHLIRAVSFQLENPAVLEEGQLVARLQAKEDDSILQTWTVERQGESDWINLAIDQEIPNRYRYIDLTLEWIGGSEDAPQVRLARATGDKEACLRTNPSSLDEHILALRVWTGNAISSDDYERNFLFPSHVEELNAHTLAVNVSPNMLAQVKPTIARKFEWDWCKAEKHDLFLHPTPAGPSIAEVDLSWASDVKGLSATLASLHKSAPEIAFSIVLAKGSISPSQIEQAAAGKISDDILATYEWTTLSAGTAQPVVVEFAEPQAKFKAYFLTNAVGGDVSYSHAWFRNLKLLL